MFAALYRLLGGENPPLVAELSALGFEVDPRATTRTPADDDALKPGRKGEYGTGQTIPPANKDPTDQPDWTFPLVIVAKRQVQHQSNPEQYLSGIDPFDNADDEPLGEQSETTPLLSHSALSHALLQAFTQSQSSGRVDTRRLSERAAAHRSLMPIPRKQQDEPVVRFWLLMDYLPELAWDIGYLQQQFDYMPVQHRPQHHIRLTHDATQWFDARDNARAFSQLPALSEGVSLLVVGNPHNPTSPLRSVLRRFSPHSSLVTWLSPAPIPRAIYWGENRVTTDDQIVIEQMKTLLWPFPMVHRAMVRACRLALGGSTAAEQSFWLSITEHEGDLLAGRCTVRRDREHYQQRLNVWLDDDQIKVQRLYAVLKPHIDAMPGTFRHRAILDLPDVLADTQAKDEATHFFLSLAKTVKASTHNHSNHHRNLCAVIAQMANGHINEPSDRLSAVIQMGQEGYSQYDKEAAIQIANPANVLSGSSAPGWVALNANGLTLIGNHMAGVVAQLDVSDDGVPVELEGQRRLTQIGDVLPSSDFTLHTASEHIDIIQRASQRYHFSESLWQDKDGVHLVTQEQVRIDYPVNGDGPQFDTSIAPTWLQGCLLGIDDYGLWSEFEIAGMGVKMRWIAPGRFQMGSPENERDRAANETQHWVTLTRGYWLAETTCTQALWEAVMGENSSEIQGPDRPVERVSWDDVQAFFKAVSQRQENGLEPVLPTEAQWEYACRAGTQTPFNLGENITPAQVNYDGNHPYGDAEKGEYREHTVDAKLFRQNAWGLYQMHGNVWEWCNDFYGDYPTDKETDPTGAETGDYRVLRGGCWIDFARDCRSGYRLRIEPSGRGSGMGFRFAQVTGIGGCGAPTGQQGRRGRGAAERGQPRPGRTTSEPVFARK